MNIQSISSQDCRKPRATFKASYVTLSEKNLGHKIANDVVDAFNNKIFPEIQKTAFVEANALIRSARVGKTDKVIVNPEDLRHNVNFFALAAGSGSRFKELAQTVGDYNKISLPFKIDENTNLHMLDFAMAMGKYFIGEEGVNKIVASQPSGSFGDIVEFYKTHPIKETIVCCGDNVFGDSAFDIMKFFIKEINNPHKHVALVGVGRTPEEVANRFGVLNAKKTLKSENLKLRGFSEKPELEEARNLAIDGKNIANTGLFYISKEAMEKLMEEINSGVNNIKKNDVELYDFANAVKYIHSKLLDWVNIRPINGADVKVVDKWEDVGEPKALYQFADDVKHGMYLHNFPQEMANNIQTAFAKRVHIYPESEYPYINFSDSLQINSKKLAEAKNIEGVNIIV